jgi:[protein-PII] uridylyltransferase
MTKAAGLGDSWKQLFERGLLTEREAQELDATNAAAHIRAACTCWPAAARTCSCSTCRRRWPNPSAIGRPPNKRASEQLMRRYYWAAKAVTQLNTILLLNIEAMLFPSESMVTRVINDRFVERQACSRSPATISTSESARHPGDVPADERTPGVKGLSPRTLRGLYNARTVMDASWRNDPENRRLFLAIIQEPQGITHALRLMNRPACWAATCPTSAASSARCSTTCSTSTRWTSTS